jgi:hypothetical protein
MTSLIFYGTEEYFCGDGCCLWLVFVPFLKNAETNGIGRRLGNRKVEEMESVKEEMHTVLRSNVVLSFFRT